MHWTEPATADDSHAELEKKLWDAANQLWSNASLKPSEYSPTVLGLIFLRYADVRFAAVEADLGRDRPPGGQSSRRRRIGPTDFHAAGVVYLPDEARFSQLLSLPEGADVGKAINEAMRAIEKENPDLADMLPKSYHILESRTLASLLKTMASISMDKGGDTFGLIYEYFLGKFAMSEGQKGGEFYTPTSIVKLIVEILEPYHGRILDPACGSGGMFIQSARFVEAHQKNPTSEISVHGQERVTDTARLARLNLAVHGLSGDIKQGNTYYEDLQDSVGRFDFVLANPPFNVSKIDKERLAGERCVAPVQGCDAGSRHPGIGSDRAVNCRTGESRARTEGPGEHHGRPRGCPRSSVGWGGLRRAGWRDRCRATHSSGRGGEDD
jgi:type I restriction enzyme M protein